MFMSPEDARSDFVLAAAAALFGSFVVGLIASLPFYPASGTLLGTVLGIAWVFVLGGLVPLLLTRYRDQALTEGLGLGSQRAGLAEGLVVALPIVVVGYLRGFSIDGPVGAALGRLGWGIGGDPVVGTGSGGGAVALAVNVLFVGVLAVSGLLLYAFLTTRSRDGFRRSELPLVEALRTFGMAAAGASLVLGLLAVAGRRVGWLAMLLNVAALTAMVLLADRHVYRGDSTSRATLLAPATVALVSQVFAFGGLFRGDLLSGLFRGSLAAGTVIVVATLIETRRASWAAVPVAAAAAIYPTCVGLPVGVVAVSPGC